MTLKNVSRFDRGELAPPKKDGNGWLRADGWIGRPGLLEYKRADGSKWVEYRPPEEAFHADTLDSFEAVPFTNDHPREGRLDAVNTKGYQVGTVSNVRQDGDRVRARVLITDAKTIADMERGKLELSMGYTCDVDETAGEINGQRYDAIQRNVRGNHVALVGAARAGPEFRLRVDSLDAEMYSPFTVVVPPEKPALALKKMKFDGAEYEIDEAAAAALARDLERMQARIDSTEKQAKDLATALAEAPAKARAAIEARQALEAQASKHDVKTDGLADLEVKRSVAEKLSGLKLEGKSETYVDAAYEMAVAQAAQTKPTPKVIPFKADEGTSDPVAAAQAKYQAALNAPFNKSTKAEN